MSLRLFGLFVVFHGLAHTAAGMAAQDVPQGLAASWLPAAWATWLATACFLLATPGFVAAGFGFLRVAGLTRYWQPLVRLAALGSALLLTLFSRSLLESGSGLVLDAMLVASTWPSRASRRGASLWSAS